MSFAIMRSTSVWESMFSYVIIVFSVTKRCWGSASLARLSELPDFVRVGFDSLFSLLFIKSFPVNCAVSFVYPLFGSVENVGRNGKVILRIEQNGVWALFGKL